MNPVKAGFCKHRWNSTNVVVIYGDKNGTIKYANFDITLAVNWFRTMQTMRLLTIIFLVITILGHAQDITMGQEKWKQEIDNLAGSNQDKLIVLVKIFEQETLKRVINQDWPENIETTFNILKNENGQIIYIGEFPTSQSGDWSLELKHYFAANGQLIAFEKRLAYFNSECTERAVIENIIELYDNKFKIIKTTKTLTDNDGKKMDEEKCSDPYQWPLDKRGTVSELVKLKRIVL